MNNCWLHSPFINGVLCFRVDGTLIWGKHNCVGKGIVSETAFPVSSGLISRIVAPLKENEIDRAHPDARRALLLLSSSITSLRQACEWGMGSVEKVWRQLLLPLPFNPEIRAMRLENILRLFNFRVRTTRIS